MTVRILLGDVREKLAELSDESVHCVVTSPPYWGLRDYGIAGQLGLERTIGEHVSAMVGVFREVRRVLRKDGTLWLNYGDCYVTSPPGNKPGWEGMKTSGLAGVKEGSVYIETLTEYSQGQRSKRDFNDGLYDRKLDLQVGHGEDRDAIWQMKADCGLKSKNLVGMPWRIAFALQADGWWLRQDIIWSKPNPMPESIKDRCTKAHEYLFLMAKAQKYYFDQEAILEPLTDALIARLEQPSLAEQHGSNRVPGKTNGPMKAVARGLSGGAYAPPGQHPHGNARRKKDLDDSARPPNTDNHKLSDFEARNGGVYPWRNKRSVWEVTTQPFSEAHFATFPPALIEPCILAGCPKGGTVLDPFFGAGTTGLVADRLGRNCIGIELNPEYAAMAERRIKGDAPLLTEVVA